MPRPYTDGPRTPSVLKDLIVDSLDSDKAIDIEVIDLSQDTALADYMVVASGTSSRQIIAMAEKLQERLTARGYKFCRTEGTDQGNWVVCDMGDVIVHLFRPEVREFYNIEEIWRLPHIAPKSTRPRVNA